MRKILIRPKILPYLMFFGALLLAAATEASPEVPSFERGGRLFEQKCAPCHTLGGGKKIGPDLKGVTDRRKREWLLRWINSPEDLIEAGDEIAREMVKAYPIRMPSPGLSREEIIDLLSYLESFQAAVPVPAELELRKEGLGEVSFSSRTYLRFFEDARGNSYGPLNERIDLEVLDKDGKWSFRSSGLAQYDLRTLSNGKRERDELTYAFFTFSPFPGSGPAFKVGRYYVFDGVAAAEHVDGIQSSWEITPLTGLSLFAGRPVETEFDGKHGDFVCGGRVSQKIKKEAEVGVSFLKEDNDGGRYREELGMDVWLLPVSPIELQGHSYWNNITSGWMEHSYTLRIPFQRFLISGLFGQSDYRNAFSASTLNAFSPDRLGGEGLTKAGASLEYSFGKAITASINYTGYSYRQSGDASYYGMAVTSGKRGLSAGLSLHRMDGETGRLRYLEFRGYAKKVFGKVTLVLDAMDVRYDLPINGLRDAYSISATALYRLNNSLSAGADIDYRKNPDFSNETVALFKLIYNLRKDL